MTAVAGAARREGVELCCEIGDFVEVRQEVVAAVQKLVGGLVLGMIRCWRGGVVVVVRSMASVGVVGGAEAVRPGQ